MGDLILEIVDIVFALIPWLVPEVVDSEVSSSESDVVVGVADVVACIAGRSALAGVSVVVVSVELLGVDSTGYSDDGGQNESAHFCKGESFFYFR